MQRAPQGVVDGHPAKECTACRVMKRLDEFHRNRVSYDGRCPTCKPCACAKTIAHRTANLERVRASDRARQKTEERRAYDRARLPGKRRREPEKYRARWKVRNAINQGLLVPEPCRECGEGNAHAHHEDYSKPLDVVWLCPVHHSARHAELRNT